MFPRLANHNTEAHRRISAIANREPEFLIAQILRLIELVKVQLYPLSEENIECLLADFRGVYFPPLASLPLEELPHAMAMYITDRHLAEEVHDLEPYEASLLLVAIEVCLADERGNPDRRPAAYSPFLSILGIDQNEADPMDILTPLGENILAIRKELRVIRNRLPQSGERITELETRLRTELLPRVSELSGGTMSEVAFAHLLAGEIHIELRQYREAQEAYSRADELKPADLTILNGLSASAAENGDFSEARRAATMITEFYPNQAEGWRNLAMVLCMSGDLDEAVAAVDRAIELDPADVTAQMIRETCLEFQRLGIAKGEPEK
jgi:tetratricopeptide (TPR) repeat protein